MSETRVSHVPTIARSAQRQVLLPALLLASSSVLFLSGCSSSLNFKPSATGATDVGTMHGTVRGGQAPVTGAAVSLYEIGATATTAAGYAAALPLTPLGTATTDASGNFAITPTACTNQSDELYLVALGGMQIGNTTPNTALVETSVAGPCNAEFASFFAINEVTTVATEYALSGFSTDYQHVGTSTTNAVGLTNAFATVTNLVNLSTGAAQTLVPAYVTPPANTNADVFAGIAPYDVMNTLGNILAACVNAAAGAADPACTNLFSYTGGANSLAVGQNGVQGPVAANTADAALYIAHNPGLPASSGFANNNVANVFNLPAPQAPFGPTLAAAPNDWTMTLNFVSGGLGGNALTNEANATQIAIDINGGVWTRDTRALTITKLTNLGTPLSPSTTLTGTTLIAHGGYPATGLTSAAAMKVDTDQQGNLWTADASNCLIALGPTGTPLTGSPFTAACPTTNAETVTVDGSNNVWVGGNGPSFIAAITNPAATALFAPVTGGLGTVGHFMAPDEAGNVWFTDGFNGDFVTSAGVLNVPYSGTFGGTPGAYGAFGTNGVGGALVLWMPQPSADDIQPVSAVSPFTPGSSFLPPTGIGEAQIWADGLDRFTWDNQGNGSTVFPNITVYLSNQTQVSPSASGYRGGSALMSLSNVATGMAIDQSGNVWVVNQNNTNNATSKNGPYGSQYLGNGSGASNITEFVGLSAPTQPVNSLNAKNHTYGVKP